MMYIYRIFLFVILPYFVIFNPSLISASAQQRNEIIQLINGVPLSTYDLTARLQMVFATTGRPESPAILQRLQAQVLETLVDERLQLDEAKRLGIVISQDEIQSALRSIEQSNNMPEGTLVPALTNRAVDIGTLIAQIEATLAWRKTISQRIRSNLIASDDEIDSYLEEIKKSDDVEYLLSEVFVAAPNPSDIARAAETIKDLRLKLDTGVPFSVLARQFSQAPTAGTGGDLGWVKSGRLAPRLVASLRDLPVGHVTEPIAIDDGYYLLALRDRRNPADRGAAEKIYHIAQYFAPFGNNLTMRERDLVLKTSRIAYPRIQGCQGISALAMEYGAQSIEQKPLRLSEMPSAIRPFIEELRDGEKTKILTLQDGVLVVVLCKTETKAIALPTRNEIENILLQRKFDVEARRYLRELRQNALIESQR